jgi:hypothetical protein
MNIKYWILGILLGCVFVAYRQNERFKKMDRIISVQSDQIKKLQSDFDIAARMFMSIQDEKAKDTMKNMKSVDWYSNQEKEVWHPVPAQ